MGRTINPDELGGASHKSGNESRRGGRNYHSSQPRQVLVSKALSRLLRHQAENLGVPITQDGWVRLDHILAWKGLTGRNGVPGDAVRIEDIWTAVEDNEKKRFAVKLVKSEAEDGVKMKGKDVGVGSGELDEQPVATVGEILGEGSTAVDKGKQPMESSAQEQTQSAGAESQEATKSDSETARAIAYYRNTSPPPAASEFMIRATQGHSIKTITSDTGLLKPVTISDLSTIPSTCVHGTFYGAWLAILGSGGLKRMGRNHVHFAEGPTLAELGFDERGEKVGDTTTEKKEVISGMRRDAQLLIYVDVKSALESEKNMEWWRSENGVILTEGVEVQQAGEATNNDQDVATQQGGSKRAQAAAQSDKSVPMKYWTVVVDVKGGRGVIWRQGDGVVQELPENLIRMGTPKGRGRGGWRVGRGERGGSRGRGG